jgi:hypothetical protein
MLQQLVQYVWLIALLRKLRWANACGGSCGWYGSSGWSIMRCAGKVPTSKG